MPRWVLLVFASAFALDLCGSVSVYLEEGKRIFTASFPLPVIDGNAVRENAIDTLEFTKREAKDGVNQITLIVNLPQVQFINISYFSLRELPKFLNLPKLDLLIFEKNELTKITDDSFSLLSVTTVYFTSNNINEIEDGAFGLKMKEVVLDCNSLTKISSNWFKNVGELRTLGLRHNKITYVEEYTFKPFVNLTSIDLAYNEIIAIGTGAFTGPTSISFLNLQNNKISEIRASVFTTPNNTIKLLNIGKNRLNFLSMDLLDKLIVERILILGNPWQCPCLRKIEHWISTKNVSAKNYAYDRVKWSADNAVCIYALSFVDTCIEVVDKELYRTYVNSNINMNPIEQC